MAVPTTTYESMSREDLIRECKNKQAVINYLNAPPEFHYEFNPRGKLIAVVFKE